MNPETNHEVHPIVKEALELAREGSEPVEFPGWAIEELKRLLAQSFGQPDLLKAVVDLINLAGLIEKEGAPKAAMDLMEVVATAAFALEDLNKK